MRCLYQTIFALCLPAAMLCTVGLAAQTPTANQTKFFEEKIRPLLIRNCYECHGEQKQKSNLRVDSLSHLLNGGDSGAAVVPGKPEESLLMAAVQYDGLEMPPKGKLPAQDIKNLKAWIEAGAVWPKTEIPLSQQRALSFTSEQREFWSFQELKPPPVPTIQSDWVANDIDQFILKRLQAKQITPAPLATPEKLLRRVYLDITGLAPPSDVVQAFSEDPSDKHYQSIVNRLLDSPQYGERWARFWMDLVRYAESDGYNSDGYRKNAWRYRDYVIKAFQQDKPYNQFITEQIAGDEIDPDNLEAQIATGYLRHWIYEYNQRDAKSQWSIILNDITDVTGDTFLGMGMSCARCHDHKFDPILQADYFRLQAFFSPLLPINSVPLATPEQVAEYQAKLEKWELATTEIRQQIETMQGPKLKSSRDAQYSKFPLDVRPFLFMDASERTPYQQQLAYLADLQVNDQIAKIKWDTHFKDSQKEKWDNLQTQLKEFEELKPSPLEVIPTVTDVSATPPRTLIQDSDQAVNPGVLSILDPEDTPISPSDRGSTTGRRTALANWLASPENPLTSRVMVNRIWQHYFGHGIVATPSDFGILGSRPTHPDLLDHLATQFVANDWSLKYIHRLILNSSTYRQSALNPIAPKARSVDGDNSLLWRANIRRLDAEQIRDNLLAASGELDRRSFGAPVEGLAPRRSIYIKVVRNKPHPLLMAFDGTDNILSTPERMTTTTPNQALLVFNNDWILQRAAKLATATMPKVDSLNSAVNQLYLKLFGRNVTDKEWQIASEYLTQSSELAVHWKDYCHVLLCSNEFIYVD